MTLREFSIGTLIVVTLLLGASGAGAAEPGPGEYDRSWPQWRGPLADGVAPHGDPPLEWSEERNVRWKVELPGRGLSTPIVWGDRVFVTTAVDSGPRPDPEVAEAAERDLPAWRREAGVAPARRLDFRVLALDRATGKVVWQTSVRTAAPHEGIHSDASWASHSPVTDGEVLVAHFGSNGTYGLDLDGKILWETDLGDMATRRGFGEGSSPVLHGDSVIVNWDHEGESFLVALERRTGKTRWKVARDEPTSWSTPLVVDVGGKPQVIVSATGATRGYDLATGQLVWQVGGMTVNAIPSPVAAGGRLFVTSGFRGSALQAIELGRARGDAAEAVVWSFGRDTPYVPSPLLYGGRLYLLKSNSAILSVFDTRSGERKFGPERLEGIDGLYASPVGAAGRVYVVGRDGTTAVLAAGDTLKLLARNELDDHFDASPAIAGGELYLRGHKRLYCLAGDAPAVKQP